MFSFNEKCKVTLCDNANIRDSYNKEINKTFVLNWNVLIDDNFSGYARDRIAVVTNELNNHFNKTGFKFISNIEYFDGLKGYKVSESTCDEGEKCIEFSDLLTNLQGREWNKKGAFQILACDFKNEYLNGFGFFPFDPYHGSIGLSIGIIGSGSKVIPHEFGHVFGLYHTFRGINEISKNALGMCSPCYEGTASDETGDFCSDTIPAPVHRDCEIPDIRSNPDPCNRNRKNRNNSNAHYNMMSYTSCESFFTEQQIRRMRCYSEYFKNKYFI